MAENWKAIDKYSLQWLRSCKLDYTCFCMRFNCWHITLIRLATEPAFCRTRKTGGGQSLNWRRFLNWRSDSRLSLICFYKLRNWRLHLVVASWAEFNDFQVACSDKASFKVSQTTIQVNWEISHNPRPSQSLSNLCSWVQAYLKKTHSLTNGTPTNPKE